MKDMNDVQLNNTDWFYIEKELCERSLAGFAKRAWRILEPSSELKWGWALDAICEHLEAVHYGEIHRLLTNVPPGCMKSLLTGVMFPAWEWGPCGMPGLRYLGTSHREPLAVRDNIKCRRLIESEWFQSMWPIEMASDQNAKVKFENKQLGFREAMSFQSMTGSRGDRVILDDPISVDQAKSPAELENAEFTFKEALPTRINDPEKSAIIVIMQRLHEKDTSGIILKNEYGYEHLMLPMRFEESRRCITKLGIADKRKEEGELLFPDRFPEEYVTKEEKGMGAYATAGQFQQRPAPRGGGLFKKDWLKTVLPHEVPQNLIKIRAWDLAGSERKKSPWTAGCLMGYDLRTDLIYILNMVRFRLNSGAMEVKLKDIAKFDGKKIPGSIPQDPGQAGKSQAKYLIKQLRPYNYSCSTETGSKIQRAEPLAMQAELGNLRLVDAPWNDAFIEEATLFPAGEFKDQIDAASRAYEQLLSRSAYTLANL